MDTTEVMTDLAGRLKEHQVFGPPVERDGVMLVPVAGIRMGGGVGGGGSESPGSGGGFGAIARPAGAWVVKEGNVSWHPAIDVNRVILGGQGVLALLLVLVIRLLRRR
jgi:uncharacterized spore protein YtfJ